MKEHALNSSDRAALQSLIPLAGALGAGTIFALFFGGRKRGSGTAMFELFAIVAVLVSVGMTAYLAIALLHANEAIDDKGLTQTAAPLIFAAFVLVVVSFVSRLPTSFDRMGTFAPLAVLVGLVAAWFAISSWSIDPSEAPLRAIEVLAVGGLGAFAAWAVDRGDRRWERGNAQRRFVRLSVAGYRVGERELGVALPGPPLSKQAVVACWVRKERFYLDSAACRLLRGRARSRWDRQAEEREGAPSGATVLARVDVTHWILALFRIRTARFWTFRPGADEQIRMQRLEANDDGLFDVTELGLV